MGTVIMFKVLSLLLLLGMANAANKQPKDLLCDVCIDVVTDIDEWLTSDQTMDDIIHFVEGLCSALGAIDPTLETLCKSLIEAQLPDIISGLVDDNPEGGRLKTPNYPAPYPARQS